MAKHFDALVTVSGGIDSTLVLYDYLRNNPTHKVLVHHCKLVNREGRADMETEAIGKVLTYLKNVTKLRNFEYTYSGFDYGNLRHIVQDIELMGFLLGVLYRSKSYTIGKVLICASKWDIECGVNYDVRAKRRFDIIRAVTDKQVNFEYPIAHMSREEVIEALPKGLRDLTWYCRRPNGNKPCGKCRTCLNTLPTLRKLGDIK
jgi:7-cyano-7-deazaguanine synthase in queuosine biosynthesis